MVYNLSKEVSPENVDEDNERAGPIVKEREFNNFA
jgi:hypothetical protein